MPSRRRRRRGRRRDRPSEPQPGGVRAFAVRSLRRRSTRWLFAAIITLTIGILLGVIGGRLGDDDESNPPPTPTLAVALPELQPPPDAASFQRADVVRVIDGDTIDVRLDGVEERVRYYGINTPERGQRCFAEATERNEALVGDTVLLLPDARERDRFDRLLRYVFTEDGASVAARLIAEGLSEAWLEDGAYRDELVALEQEVRALGEGCLWGEGG